MNNQLINMAIWIPVLSIAFLGYSGSASADTPLVNPSFETGSTHGWTETIPLGGSVNVVSEFEADESSLDYGGPTYYAQNGNYFALLKTNGPGSQTMLTQSLTVKAGETITGRAFFDARDYAPFNDSAQIVIVDEYSNPIEVFYADVLGVGAYGETPWTEWSHTFEPDGNYTIVARVTNYGDGLFPSFMGVEIDDWNKATGGGTVDFLSNRVSFGFVAIGTDNNYGAKGQFQFRSAITNFKAHAKVVSLAVDGNNAWIGAVVTKSNDESLLAVGAEFFMRVADNGEGSQSARDQLSFPIPGSSDVSTMPDVDLIDWTNGNVQVYDITTK